MTAATDTSRSTDRTAHPVRTCVGCRSRADRPSLLRIVASADGTTVVLDARKTMPGRGAWLHPDIVCLRTATTRRAWGRALRLRSAVRTDELDRVLVEIIATSSLPGDTTQEPQRAVSHDHDRKRV